MRFLDALRTDAKTRQERNELRSLTARLNQYTGEAESRRKTLCVNAVTQALGLAAGDTLPPVARPALLLCHGLLMSEGHLYLPAVDSDRPRSLAETWELKAAITRALVPLEQTDKAELLENALSVLVRGITNGLPSFTDTQEEAATLTVPLYALLPNPAAALETVFGVAFNADVMQAGFFEQLRQRLDANVCVASGIDPSQPDKRHKAPIFPGKSDLAPAELVTAYLAGTLLLDFFQTPLPFSIPFRTRFEHTHIIGGSGHGKTQLLQHLILRDLRALQEGRGSIIVIDSQGDMLRTITQLAELSPSHPASLADRLVLIDPNDVEHPPALNLFDFGLERLKNYSPVEREKLINGAIALYEYVFGALLGAELTQRQGVIFRYLARLIMTIPGATIHTLMHFMEDPEATRSHFTKLDPTSRHFFETQFFSRSFDDTRQQILTRLWGVLSNRVLERMFANEHNKLDLFSAMNRGSLILINTAKDLLKQEGCEILGRFFIALITQAAQERAAIPDDRRRSTFVFIDEAHDYFDESIQNLFNQARKYKVGLIIAHQNLDQFGTTLRATVMASTSTKLVGGLSAKDAAAFAREMHCEPEFLQGMRKHRDHTEFACFVRNYTPQPIRLTVPFGEMERRPKLSAAESAALLEGNRRRVAGGDADPASPTDRQITSGSAGPSLGTHDLL